jgi:aldose 1-epimerase
MKDAILRHFGQLDGREIREVTLATDQAEANIIEYGAVVRDLAVRKADGTMQRVVLGLNSVEDYVQHAPHFGAIAGRYANRIRGGRFVLDGVAHQLVLNQDGKHHLHGGGPVGFGKLPWTMVHHDQASVTLVHVSPDGTNGYPGTAQVTCRYTLTGKTLRIELWGTTDKPTIMNLCHHSYFNLDGGTDILDHMLAVRANVMTPTDADLIPNGELKAVAETAFDFRVARPVRLTAPDGKRHLYDHNFMLRREKTEPSVADGLRLAHAATLASKSSGVALECWTTEPCLHVYDGFKLDLPVPGLGGTRYRANAGLCLEPQHAPDSPNLPHFPSTVLRPGELYRQVTEYRFG